MPDYDGGGLRVTQGGPHLTNMREGEKHKNTGPRRSKDRPAVQLSDTDDEEEDGVRSTSGDRLALKLSDTEDEDDYAEMSQRGTVQPSETDDEEEYEERSLSNDRLEAQLSGTDDEEEYDETKAPSGKRKWEGSPTVDLPYHAAGT